MSGRIELSARLIALFLLSFGFIGCNDSTDNVWVSKKPLSVLHCESSTLLKKLFSTQPILFERKQFLTDTFLIDTISLNSRVDTFFAQASSLKDQICYHNYTNEVAEILEYTYTDSAGGIEFTIKQIGSCGPLILLRDTLFRLSVANKPYEDTWSKYRYYLQDTVGLAYFQWIDHYELKHLP